MRRAFRISLILGVVVVLLARVPFLISVNQFRPIIEERASAALGRKVELGPLSLALLRGSLSAETIAIGDDPAFSTSPFLIARSVKVGIELWPLMASRSLNVTGVTIEGPEVTLIQNAAGRWNYSSLGSSSSASASSPPGLLIKKIELIEGRVLVASTTAQTRRSYDHVKVTASDVSLTSGSPVTASAALAGGGTLALAGTVGPLDQVDASLTPLDAQLTITRLNLATSGVLDASSGLGGLLDMKATLVSKNGEAAIAGSATLSKALLVAGGSPASQPVVVAFKTKYRLQTQAGVLNACTLKIGGAAAHVTGTYKGGGEYPAVNIKIVGDNMPVQKLQSFLPALGIQLPKGASLAAGTLAANLGVVGPTNKFVTTGTVGLSHARLAGFDLGSEARAIAAFGGLNTGTDLDIESATTNLRMAPDGLRFDKINTVVRSLGRLAGAGTIDGSNQLDFKMVAILPNSLAGGAGAVVPAGVPAAAAGAGNDVLGRFGRGGSGSSQTQTQSVPFFIQGTTSAPKFVPDVSGAVMQIKGQSGTKPWLP